MSRGDLAVAPDVAAARLIGARWESGSGDRLVSGILVEVEAYGGPPDSPWPDPGAHTWPGPTGRNRAMFGPAGHLYVYRSHGLHFCANVTAGPEGEGAGCLIRAVAVDGGAALARARRGLPADGSGDRRLAAGPGNVGSAFGITMDDYGVDLLDPASPVRLLGGSRIPDADILAGPRVGLRRASQRPWRLRLRGAPTSAYRRHPRADGES